MSQKFFFTNRQVFSFFFFGLLGTSGVVTPNKSQFQCTITGVQRGEEDSGIDEECVAGTTIS